MSTHRLTRLHILLVLTLTLGTTFGFAAPAAAPTAAPAARVEATGAPALVRVAPQKATGIYNAGEKIVWTVDVDKKAAAGTVTGATYTILKGGMATLSEGKIDLTKGRATITATSNDPGTLLLEVTPISTAEENPTKVLGGAVINPEKIAVSSPVPDDFDSFWKGKIEELQAVPANPVLDKQDSGSAMADYWKITMDNIRGTHVRGQLARPVKGDKFPAMLIVQYAGVYPLQKKWVTDPAEKGWLVLNIIAHDLPIDEPKEFYDSLAKTDLKDYVAIGNDSRETSYFLRMFLACYRAADYLAQRPDWNGQVLVVTGTSQGGLQSFVTAGLHPKITAMMVNVPAGCDHTGALVNRKPGWPSWAARAGKKDPTSVLETSRYFDGVNFASRVKCPALVSAGLIDTTARPEGIIAAYNQLQGPKELVILPLSDHKGKNNTQAPYHQRATAWKDALLQGQSVPAK